MKETKHLLDDESAPVDELSEKTHEALAEQLYKLITESTDDGCVIGLEGKWGAGKSTVVQILLKKLASNPEKLAFPFYIDAWEHEGDSLRRMFLSSFVEELLSKKWEDTKDFLEEKKKEINSKESKSKVKSSSSMSAFGKCVAFLAVFVPLGCAIIEKTWEEVTFGIGLPVHKRFALGLALALAPLGAYLVQGCRWLWSWCRGKTKPKFGWFDVNSEIQTSETTTEETEKDSVAFSQYFIKLVEGVKKHISNLVVIVDNLDRINHRDALKIWSTLQTFVRAKEKITAVKLWVVIPYTEEGIKALWENERQEDEEEEAANQGNGKGIAKSKHNLHVGKSFLDKTFQLRLDVPDLLIGDWQSFAEKKAKEVFVNFPESNVKLILDVLCWARRNSSDAPSPREIKLYLNQVRLLHDIHSKDEVQLSSICFYATQRYLHGMSRTELEKSLLKGGISSHSLPLDANNDHLVEDLCAILFHVPRGKGIQILLENQIKSCLETGRKKELRALYQTHGTAFVDILGHILSHAPDDISFSYALCVQEGLADLSPVFHDMALSHWRDRIQLQTNNIFVDIPYLSIIQFGPIVRTDSQLSEQTWRFFALSFRRDLVEKKFTPDLWLQYLDKAQAAYGINIQIEYSADMFQMLKQCGMLNRGEARRLASYMNLTSSAEDQVAANIQPGTELEDGLPGAFSILVDAGLQFVDKTVAALQKAFSPPGRHAEKLFQMVSCFDRLRDKQQRNQIIKSFLKLVPMWDAMLSIRSEYPKNLLAYLIPKHLESLDVGRVSSTLKIRQDVIAGIVNRWNDYSPPTGDSIYQFTQFSGDYAYLNMLAKSDKNKLVGRIVDCALRDGDVRLGKGDDAFNRFASFVQFVSEDKHCDLAKLFVEAGNVVEELCSDQSPFSLNAIHALSLLLENMEDADVIRAKPQIEKVLASVSQADWEHLFEAPQHIAELFACLNVEQGFASLSNPYCEALKKCLATLFGAKNDQLSASDINELFKPLSPEFREEIAVHINQLAERSSFKLNSSSAGLVLNHAAHDKWDNPDGERLCQAIQQAITNKSKDELLRLVPILSAGKKRFNPSHRFSSTLREPVAAWIKDGSEDVRKTLADLCSLLNIKLDPPPPSCDNPKP